MRGSAYDFCLRVTQRRHRDDLDLVATGPDADQWLDIAQAFADPQVVARGLVLEQPTAPGSEVPAIRGVASPLRLADNPPLVRNAPPNLGEHTAEVLADLGVDEAGLASLRKAGVV